MRDTAHLTLLLALGCGCRDECRWEHDHLLDYVMFQGVGIPLLASSRKQGNEVGGEIENLRRLGMKMAREK